MYQKLVVLFTPLTLFLTYLLKHRVQPRSVLHISFHNHTTRQQVDLLQRQGYYARYLAVGTLGPSPAPDFHVCFKGPDFLRFFHDYFVFWKTISRFEIIHSHFLTMISKSDWEWAVLNKLDRKIVAHLRGCEYRNPEYIEQKDPKVNLCQNCDYARKLCSSETALKKRTQSRLHADQFLVTTKDLLDFVPAAKHLPLLSPELKRNPRPTPQDKSLRILHATNHPGLEATNHIRHICDQLRGHGYNIELRTVSGETHEKLLQELEQCDLTIGKMKMGYYANFQIESLAHEVPTICYIREDLWEKDFENAGIISCHLNNLKETLIEIYESPELLTTKKNHCHNFLQRHHNNKNTTQELIKIYEHIRPRAS